MTAPVPSQEKNFKLLVILAAVAVAAWVWHCACVFPFHSWNEIRLAPTFLWADGQTVYATADGGPASTWIYGPLPLLFFWPATWAPSAATALLTAAGLNFAAVAGTIFLFCGRAPDFNSLGKWKRAAAALAVVACWPRSAFQYLQADNLAIACGLLGMLALMRVKPADQNPWREWVAAFFAAAAVACKQTAIEAAVAQVVWLALTAGRREAMIHAIRLGTGGAALAGAALLAFDAPGLWFNLIELPGRLPWVDDAIARIAEHAPAILVQIALPALLLFAFRRHVMNRASPFGLPALTWLFSLIPGVAGILKIGGSSNSLHGLPYLLPVAFLFVAQRASAAGKFQWAPAGLAAAAALVAGARMATLPAQVWRPLTMHLHEAAVIARELPGQVWFPWNPIITFYAEGRVDHTEDGLVIRRLAHRSATVVLDHRHLPPYWHVTAMRVGERDWGLARSLKGPATQTTTLGLWRVDSWAPTPGATAAETARATP